MENKEIFRECLRKENEYQERIKQLEHKILTSEKSDIILLQNKNKEYESNIIKLNHTINNLIQKHEEETSRYKSMIGELLLTRDSINIEISLVQSLLSKISESPMRNLQHKEKRKVMFSKKFKRFKTLDENSLKNTN